MRTLVSGDDAMRRARLLGDRAAALYGAAPMRRMRWSVVVAGVALVVVVAGAGVALAGRPHTGRLRTPSEGMAPTIPLNAVVTADYDAYRHAAPRIGDIVVVHPPMALGAGGDCSVPGPPHGMCPGAGPRPSATLLIKRVVAGPGDRVALRRGRVIRNGRPAAEPYARGCSEQCDFPSAIVVPAGQYVVLGDNRADSYDSRFWGPARRSWIVARVDRCNPLGFHCSPRR
jgi:signal peptidase I